MYKKIFAGTFLFSTVLLNSLAIAQPKGKRQGSVNFYVTGAADFQSNGYDVDFTIPEDGITVGENPAQDGLLRCKDKIGGRLGFEMVRYTRNLLIIATGFDLRMVPQKVSLVYNANENGFENSSYSMQQDFTFVNYSVDMKFRMGVSLHLPNKGAIDILLGPVFNIPFNGTDNDGGTAIYAQTDNNSQYKNLIMYQQVGWGSRKHNNNETTVLPMNLLANFQLGYRFRPSSLFANKNFRAGIDFNARLAGNYNNQIQVTVFDANRKSKGMQSFDDAMISLGLFAAFEL
ncbi:hypothetical protein CAP35_05395 [Chitinophagaceae bacterium IBVUCB1]|nr:hypothetical protein CAP35_05395 [Chitinophagaceae bacterium IBVUCB1]